MKKSSKIELLWLLGLLVISFLLLLFIFNPSEGLWPDSVLDINVHDTYFVFSSWDFTLITFSTLVFLVYLLRILFLKTLIIRNLIFLINSCIFIFYSSTLLAITSLFTISSGYTIYPPLSSDNDNSQLIEQSERAMERQNEIFYYFIFFVIIILIVQTIVAFKTGMHWKNKKTL